MLKAGCGIGLSSLVLNRRMTNMTATIYHPEAGTLPRQKSDLKRDRKTPFIRSGWNHGDCEPDRFDLIIGCCMSAAIPKSCPLLSTAMPTIMVK